MNTKVKVGIASAIVAALVALIYLDQKTTPKDDSAARPAAPGSEAIVVGGGSGADAPAQRLRNDEIESLLREAETKFKQPKSAGTTGAPLKGSEEKNEKKIPSAGPDEYVILEGDTFETIAQKRLGSKTFATLIAEANPDLKATALRVGKTIKIPAKPEPVIAKETITTPVPPPPPAKPEALQTVGNQRIYTVQPSDTLSGISTKVYGTSRHYKKIHDANKDVIDDPNTLQVGAKLVMPDLPVRAPAANGAAAGTVSTTNPAPTVAPPGAKLVQVSQGSSLWKIAEKFASEKKIGIHDMIKQIVAANPDKLKDENSLLKVGLELIIPE
jgi:nucleoid-associated protein YgaU